MKSSVNRNKHACIFIALAIALAACGTTRSVTIRGFERLFITDLATDNTTPTAGTAGAVSVPIKGIMTDGQYAQGGILSANKFIIEGATGATIVIERGVSGNHNVDVEQALERIFLPTSHPFGNVIIEGDSSMREHVEN